MNCFDITKMIGHALKSLLHRLDGICGYNIVISSGVDKRGEIVAAFLVLKFQPGPRLTSGHIPIVKPPLQRLNGLGYFVRLCIRFKALKGISQGTHEQHKRCEALLAVNDIPLVAVVDDDNCAKEVTGEVLDVITQVGLDVYEKLLYLVMGFPRIPFGSRYKKYSASLLTLLTCALISICLIQLLLQLLQLVFKRLFHHRNGVLQVVAVVERQLVIPIAPMAFLTHVATKP